MLGLRPRSPSTKKCPMPASAKRLPAKKPAAKPRVGAAPLPEWNLADLYSGLDDPRIARDLDRADAEAQAFEAAFRGKLAALADSAHAGQRLAEAVKRYEALDDLIGKVISYAGLVHAGNTVDPARAKFYG